MTEAKKYVARFMRIRIKGAYLAKYDKKSSFLIVVIFRKSHSVFLCFFRVTSLISIDFA